ncbi:MAG: hypothetical protein H0X29_00305 [Parachlamydiaceae bacterium]|nr:hypothetical protein [Parachlamydiaceae bacterium]
MFYRNQFYEHAKANKIIFGEYFRPEHIQPGDTILVSTSAQRCKPDYRDLAPSELLVNLNLADALIQEVQEKIPLSTNYSSRTFKAEEVNRKELIRLSLKFQDLEFNGLRKRSILEMVRIFEKIKMGNCSDLALAGLVYALKKNPFQRIEKAIIVDGNHAFLVIGREKESNAADYKTWGKNSVICDPWANKCYPVAKVERELYDFLGCYEDESVNERNYNGIRYPYVRPFNPLKQSLECLFISRKEILSDLSETADQ